jgi:hypothetical protein
MDLERHFAVQTGFVAIIADWRVELSEIDAAFEGSGLVSSTVKKF